MCTTYSQELGASLIGTAKSSGMTKTFKITFAENSPLNSVYQQADEHRLRRLASYKLHLIRTSLRAPPKCSKDRSLLSFKCMRQQSSKRSRRLFAGRDVLPS